jgi:aspartyl-tRNA(Asn)/glutamyl-tRNA(Gln) amidotransferase subunit A
MSIPCGFVEGLPVGMQIIGKPFGEAEMLRVAFAYEQATGWERRRVSL